MKRIVTSVIFLGALLCAKPSDILLPRVIIGGDAGGVVTGGEWDSAALSGRTVMLFYVDPDEKEKGRRLLPVMEAAELEFPPENFQIHFVVNLAATWKPGLLVQMLLKEKAAAFPRRTYAVDKKGMLVKQWGLADDAYNCVILGPGGKVLFDHNGEWSDDQIEQVRTILQTACGRQPAVARQSDFRSGR